MFGFGGKGVLDSTGMCQVTVLSDIFMGILKPKLIAAIAKGHKMTFSVPRQNNSTIIEYKRTNVKMAATNHLAAKHNLLAVAKHTPDHPRLPRNGTDVGIDNDH